MTIGFGWGSSSHCIWQHNKSSSNMKRSPLLCWHNYCNTLLFGLPKYQLDHLQKVQNATAWFSDLLNLIIVNLHWLPAVTSRVQFKLLLFVYKSLHNQSPLYIKDLLSLKPAANYAHLKSTRSTLRDRAFAHAVPVLWNSLPLTIRSSSSLAIFKKHQNFKLIIYRNSS